MGNAMQAPPEIVHGGNLVSLGGIFVSAWQWAAGDANGFTIILTVSTILLTIIKILDAIRKWVWQAEVMGVNRPILQRIRDAVTRPAPLDD